MSSSVVSCPVYGHPVNKDAVGCPICSSSPHLSPDEAEAVRAAMADKQAVTPDRPLHKPGWTLRLRALALLPALLSPIGVLVYGLEFYQEQNLPNATSDYRASLALGVAVVCVLSLAPALLVVLPRRLILALAVAGSLVALPLAVEFGLNVHWSGSLLLLVAGFAYVPALAIVRCTLQRRADRPEEVLGEPRPVLHVVKASLAGVGLAVAVLFLSGLVLLGVAAGAWTVHTRTAKTSPDGQWSLIIDTYDEGALGGSTSVELHALKGDAKDVLLYDGDWLADAEVRWGKGGGAVLIGGRVVHPAPSGDATQSPAPE